MQEHNLKRQNRVFKSLHKPLTYLGVERTVFYFVCVGAVGVFNLFESLLAGIVVFFGGFIFGRWVTNVDPANYFVRSSDSVRCIVWNPAEYWTGLRH